MPDRNPRPEKTPMTTESNARAMLVMVDLETGETMHEGPFVDAGTGLDPCHHAEALWESVKGDWPDFTHAIVMNDAARELKAQRLLWACGMTDSDDEMHDRIEAHNAGIAHD